MNEDLTEHDLTRRMGKLTEEKVVKIALSMARGLTEEQACIVHKVKVETFRSARKRNPDYEEIFQKAKAEFVDDATQKIYNGEKGWQGAAWILERRHRAQFARAEVQIQQQAPQTAISQDDLNMLAEVQRQLTNRAN